MGQSTGRGAARRDGTCRGAAERIGRRIGRVATIMHRTLARCYRRDMRASPERAPVVCLAGPTAVGKTAVALAAARQRPLEIISMDSALVYRGLDIGTAKPGADERGQVPHHLIDILEPTQAYSAAAFAADAARLAAQVRGRGREPLIVGGTMLYFKALAEGLHALPAADPALRAALEARAAAEGWPALHAKLARLDPPTAARLAPHDAQRVQRALEVVMVSGVPLSRWHEAGAGRAAGGAVPLRLVSLEPAGSGGRAWLHQRIAQRFDAMLAAGFVDEVRALRARGDLHAALPAMRAVGYRQAWAALEAGDERPLREQGIAATRQLAKRQLTWLRSWPQRVVVAADAPDALELACIALDGAWRGP
jgi:tRNA dimethylallyltransferase